LGQSDLLPLLECGWLLQQLLLLLLLLLRCVLV
jgi:hypothetical protein